MTRPGRGRPSQPPLPPERTHGRGLTGAVGVLLIVPQPAPQARPCLFGRPGGWHCISYCYGLELHHIREDDAFSAFEQQFPPHPSAGCSPSTVGRAWITDVGSDARAAVVSLHGRLGSSRNRPPAYWSSRHSASSQPAGSGTAPSPFARGGSRHPRRCRSRAAADARLTGQAGPSAEPRRTASRAPQMPASGRWEVAGSAGASASSGPGRPATARGRPRDPPAP